MNVTHVYPLTPSQTDPHPHPITQPPYPAPPHPSPVRPALPALCSADALDTHRTSNLAMPPPSSKIFCLARPASTTYLRGCVTRGVPTSKRNLLQDRVL